MQIQYLQEDLFDRLKEPPANPLLEKVREQPVPLFSGEGFGAGKQKTLIRNLPILEDSNYASGN